MTVLNSKKILQEKNASDPNSVTNLTLTQKALSDVSCLGDFKSLERLDLGFNNLTSVEALGKCVNLKWLSVVQNKLQSLKGIEGLTKLTVLNAGKNKLKTMDDVRSLVSMRALILNDNEISSISKLDQMKELNTLVLSRNPVSKIGDSLVKTKSLTKLSLSNCRLQTIGSSLTSCTELKELRLAHNEIKTLPVELSHNSKLQNLDVGNNLITNWSDLKVLSSLANLRNLNLQGNPISEKETLAKKIKKLLPNLQIFNARPTDKTMKKEVDGSNSYITDSNVLAGQKEDRTDNSRGQKNSKKYLLGIEEGDDQPLGNAEDRATEKESDNKKHKRNKLLKEKLVSTKERVTSENERKKNSKLELNKDVSADGSKLPPVNPKAGKELKRKKLEREEDHGEDSIIPTKGDGKLKKKLKQHTGNIIDDGEAPFVELFTTDVAENAISRGQKMEQKSVPGIDSAGAIVKFPKQSKKKKNLGDRAANFDLSPVAEVGLGGPSTWDD
ncbi:uncharacterized protein LOC113778516 isoform X1 [Coffea eugenioides]|uniref:uncharacterized protein LOC113778516 isoform X1 n=1 Tax=Coffea eugenioides TaxID=49369 RepID=UPI000F604D0A|nr:uncharacterized protein LOC113778516 isoform X1 [Coffea eugenioides]